MEDKLIKRYREEYRKLCCFKEKLRELRQEKKIKSTTALSKLLKQQGVFASHTILETYEFIPIADIRDEYIEFRYQQYFSHFEENGFDPNNWSNDVKRFKKTLGIRMEVLYGLANFYEISTDVLFQYIPLDSNAGTSMGDYAIFQDIIKEYPYIFTELLPDQTYNRIIELYLQLYQLRADYDVIMKGKNFSGNDIIRKIVKDIPIESVSEDLYIPQEIDPYNSEISEEDAADAVYRRRNEIFPYGSWGEEDALKEARAKRNLEQKVQDTEIALLTSVLNSVKMDITNYFVKYKYVNQNQNRNKLIEKYGVK